MYKNIPSNIYTDVYGEILSLCGNILITTIQGEKKYIQKLNGQELWELVIQKKDYVSLIAKFYQEKAKSKSKGRDKMRPFSEYCRDLEFSQKTTAFEKEVLIRLLDLEISFDVLCNPEIDNNERITNHSADKGNAKPDGRIEEQPLFDLNVLRVKKWNRKEIYRFNSKIIKLVFYIIFIYCLLITMLMGIIAFSLNLNQDVFIDDLKFKNILFFLSAVSVSYFSIVFFYLKWQLRTFRENVLD